MGKLNLQSRLVILMVTAFLPLLVLSVWLSVREAEAARERARSQLKTTATLVAASQNQIIDSVRMLLAAAVAHEEMKTFDGAQCQAYFRTLQVRFPLYANMGLIDPRGEVICHALGPGRRFNAADRHYFRQAVEKRRFSMGEPALGRATGTFVIAFGQPVMRGDEVVAVAFASVDLAQAAKLLSEVELPPAVRLQVTDRRGTVLMDQGDGAEGNIGRQVRTPLILQASRHLVSGTGDATDAQGQARIFAFAPLQQVNDDGLLVTVSMPSRHATAAADAALRNALGALALMLLLGAAGVWWLGGIVIVGPTRQILRAIRQLEQGRLDARVFLQGHMRGRELASIAAGVNQMAESLQARRREIDAALSESRDAYAVLETVLNTLQEGLIAMNPAGKFVIYNQAATAVFAVDDADRLPRQDWSRFFGAYLPDGRTLYEARDLPLPRALQGETGSCLIFARNERVPDGRMLQCHYRPMRDDAGAVSGGIMVFTDITEVRKTEAELMLLRNPLARLNDIVVITEAQPIDLPGPRIVFVNQTFERLTGYSAEEAIGQTPRMLQGPQTDRATLDRIRAALQRWEPVREEIVNYTKSGAAVWVEIDIAPLADDAGHFTHWISVQRDITARREAQDALNASQTQLRELNAVLESRIAERTAELARNEAMFRALAEQAPAVVWMADTKGNATYLSPGWEEITGDTPEEGLGRQWLNRLHPDDKVAMADLWEQHTRSREKASSTRRFLAKDGSWRTTVYRATPVEDTQGRVAFWVGIDTDITEFKAVEDALRSTNEELKAFSYSVSHDLRAPLAAIDGFSRALAEKLDGQGDDRTRHYLTRIRASVAKMDELIGALLALSKVVRAPLAFAAVDLGAMAKDILAGLRERDPARQVQIRVQEDLSVHGDAPLLGVMLENLLGNAWKFTSRRDEARIEVGRLDHRGAFFVRDNGAGFDMAHAGRLFDAFKRLHAESEFPGTGVGLATVYRIVARHRGRIWAESTPGVGTTFLFTLPDAAPPPRVSGAPGP